MSTLNHLRPSNFLFISFKNLLGGPTSWASLCKLGKSRFSHSNDYEESLLKKVYGYLLRVKHHLNILTFAGGMGKIKN